ncbi:MAG TPA: crossover junction endodeoxyribonuclease RuvC [Bdellovibrionota bacterium]|nr:crossover junction endodeoxyribonuclease RuvC [Bdellovibrionota bacterium]
MIVAGLDPGSRRAGYAVLRMDSHAMEIITMGSWDLVKIAGPDFGDRICELHRLVTEFYKSHNPHVIGFEKAVAFKNIASAMKLSEARGVIRLAAHQVLAEAPKRFIELSPTEIKRSAAGLGFSSKASIERALRLRFPGSRAFLEAAAEGSGKIAHDAFDAVAIAWAAKARFRLGTFGKGKIDVDAGT